MYLLLMLVHFTHFHHYSKFWLVLSQSECSNPCHNCLFIFYGSVFLVMVGFFSVL